MSTEEVQTTVQHEDTTMQQDEVSPPTGPGGGAAATRKRPRLDMTTEPRKRGKTMFGLVLGTLTKAKNEDQERNASEAARKRQLIEQRLQDKLRKETDSVRRAEEAKKDKTTANRKEEELQLKDSIFKLRRKRLPILANFLSTADRIPPTEDEVNSLPPTPNPLATHPRSHPPSLYFLPAILTPAQEAFLKRRKTEVDEASEKEWQRFQEERKTGLEEINRLRQRVAEEEARQKSDQQQKPQPTPSEQQQQQQQARGQEQGPSEPTPAPEQDVKMGEEPERGETPTKEKEAAISAASSTTAPSEPSSAEVKKEQQQREDKKEVKKKEEREDGPPGLAPTKMDVDEAELKVKEEKPAFPVKGKEPAPAPSAPAPVPTATMQADEDDAVEY